MNCVSWYFAYEKIHDQKETDIINLKNVQREAADEKDDSGDFLLSRVNTCWVPVADNCIYVSVSSYL